MGKLLRTNTNGTIHAHWYEAPNANRPGGPYLPCWWDGHSHYRSARPENPAHTAFTSPHAAEHAKLTQRDIVIHGFELEHDGHMPTTLLDACSANTDIWWSRRTTRRMELKRAVQPKRARKTTESSEQKTKRARNSS